MSTRKVSKFDGVFDRVSADEAPAAERVEKPPVVLARPPAGLPDAMNFKLTPEHSWDLHRHFSKTRRPKQAIVREALDEWLKRNKGLIEGE